MREGYKDSVLGKIPENWKSLKVGEVCRLKGGFAFKSSDSCEEGIKWLKIANVGVNKIKWEEKSFLPFGFETQHNEFVLTEGNVVIAMTRPILSGKLKIAKIGEMDSGSLLNQRVGRIESKECLCEEYAYQYFNSVAFITKMEKELIGTDPPNISSSMFELLDIPLPPLPEQQKIAEILSTVDDKIYVIDQQITETQELKKGLMQRLLTKGIGHTEFKDSPLGEIPKSWEVGKLAEVSIKIGDGLHSTPKYVEDSDYYFVNGNNLVNGKLTIFENTKCVSEPEYLKHNINIDSSSILMSINGTIGNIAFYNGELVVFGKSACYISPNIKKLDKYYLYYYLQMNEIKKYYSDELTGTTIKNLSLKTVRNTPTALPKMGEQQKIASILTSVDEKLEVLGDKKTNYQELKQGLMQQLLTGKIRVAV